MEETADIGNIIGVDQTVEQSFFLSGVTVPLVLNEMGGGGGHSAIWHVTHLYIVTHGWTDRQVNMILSPVYWLPLTRYCHQYWPVCLPLTRYCHQYWPVCLPLTRYCHQYWPICLPLILWLQQPEKSVCTTLNEFLSTKSRH